MAQRQLPCSYHCSGVCFSVFLLMEMYFKDIHTASLGKIFEIMKSDYEKNKIHWHTNINYSVSYITAPPKNLLITH